MASIRAIAKAYDRVENRIIYLGRKAFKKIRKDMLKMVKEGGIPFFDIQQMAKAYEIGLKTAYVYGKMAAIGGITGRRNIKKKFGEEDVIIEMILKKDGSVIKSLLSGRGRRMNPSEVFKNYFEVSPATLDL